MIVRHYSDIEPKTVGEGAKDTAIRWLIADSEGAENFYMRMLELAPGGQTPDHAHEWEHEVYVLEGTGMLMGKTEQQPLAPGAFAFVEGGTQHYFKNTGEGVLRFLCLIPAKKNK